MIKRPTHRRSARLPLTGLSLAALSLGALCLGALCLGAMSFGAQAWAAAPSPVNPQTLIAARQAGFAFMAGNFEAMKNTIKAGGAPRQYADTAAEMVEWGELIPALFPAGTETGHDTKALPAVFSDADGFAKRAADFTAAAKALKAASEANDAKAFAAAFKQTGQACGACHKAYRAKD